MACDRIYIDELENIGASQSRSTGERYWISAWRLEKDRTDATQDEGLHDIAISRYSAWSWRVIEQHEPHSVKLW